MVVVIFIVGIGGSATNDGGIGMLQALGYDFLDKDGAPVAYGGAGLQSIARIQAENILPELKDCTFRVACDVTIRSVVQWARVPFTARKKVPLQKW